MPRRLGRFRSVINLLSEKHEFVPLLRSFAIFAPQSTLMVYFLFYQSFVARKYASAKLHMIEFVARLSNGSTASTSSTASTASSAASAGASAASAASAGASAASAGASAASAPLIPIQWIRALAETQLKQLLLNNVKDSYACEQLLSILSHFDEEYVLLHTTYKVSQQMCLLQQHNDHAPPHQAAPHRLMASSIDLFVSPSDVVSQLLRRHMFQEARTYATTMYNKKTNLTKRILSQDQVHRVTMCEINDTLSRFQRVSFMISI
jgi:hypothetical protein